MKITVNTKNILDQRINGKKTRYPTLKIYGVMQGARGMKKIFIYRQLNIGLTMAYFYTHAEQFYNWCGTHHVIELPIMSVIGT